MNARHVPQRTCIACRRPRSKKELVRLVRLSSGHVSVAVRGKEAGRGAYVCASVPCWQEALRGGRVEYALKVSIGPSARERLLEEGAAMLAQVTLGGESVA